VARNSAITSSPGGTRSSWAGAGSNTSSSQVSMRLSASCQLWVESRESCGTGWSVLTWLT
jgi:hypothetical protein